MQNNEAAQDFAFLSVTPHGCKKTAQMQAQEKPAMCNNATAKRGSHMVVGFNSLV